MHKRLFHVQLTPLVVIPFLAIVLGGCRTTQQLASQSQRVYEAEMIHIDQHLAEDTAMAIYIAPFRQQMNDEMNAVIGTSQQALVKSSSQGSSLGGIFFADALLALGQALDPEVSCSFATKGGIRTDLPKGDITIGHIFELMPFDNYITILSVKGEDLLDLGDYIAQTHGQPIAGMSVVVQENTLVEMRIGDQLVDPDKSYKLVTYDYIANGGDRVDALTKPLQRTDTKTRVREGLIAYIKSLTANNLPINIAIDERVKIIQ